jgi:hypothetical protein
MGILFTGLLVSLAGMGLFMYGRSQRRAPQLGTGIVLMIYPQVADSSLEMLLVSGGIVFLMWLGLRLGV